MDIMLERFVEEYSDKAFHFAYRLCGNVEQSKELVQEAFFRIIKKWDQYDAAQPLENWFYAVLRNIFTDGRRSFERRNCLSLDADAPAEDGETLADALPDEREAALLTQVERQDSSRQVRLVLDALNAEQRAVLTLSDLQGMSYEEISRVMGCSSGAVRSRVFRAREAFREMMLTMFRQEAMDYAL